MLIQYCLPMISHEELYTLICLSGVQRERTREEKILTDHIVLNVLFPREFNSVEGLHYRLLAVCNCTKKVAEVADRKGKKPKTSEVTKVNKVSAKHAGKLI